MTPNIFLKRKKNFFGFLQNISPFGKTKTHDFRKFQKNADYYIDFADSYNSARIVTNIDVTTGEHILLTDRKQTLKYRAEAVEYYWNNDSLREIKLKHISQ